MNATARRCLFSGWPRWHFRGFTSQLPLCLGGTSEDGGYPERFAKQALGHNTMLCIALTRETRKVVIADRLRNTKSKRQIGRPCRLL